MVVTRAPLKEGASVSGGSVVAEVSGRPVIALLGTIPAYRTLLAGSKGNDVLQLQEALTSVGFPTTGTGVFDKGTQTTLGQLYRSRGYQPPQGDGKGISLPAEEVVFLKRFPAVVVGRSVGLGRTPGSQPVVSLAANPPEIVVGLTESDAGVVKVGQHCSVQVDGVADSIAAKVVRVGSPGTGANGQPEVPATLESTQLDPSLSGKIATASMSIRITSTRVLSVPIAAVWLNPAGGQEVTVLDSDGQARDIAVKAGGSGGGYIEVQSRTPGDLVAGDHVVIK